VFIEYRFEPDSCQWFFVYRINRDDSGIRNFGGPPWPPEVLPMRSVPHSSGLPGHH